MIIQNFKYIEEFSDGYLINAENATIKLIFMTDDIIRARVSFDHTFKEESYALVLTAWDDRFDELLKEERTRIDALKVEYKDKGDYLEFNTRTLQLRIYKTPLYFRIFDLNSRLIYSDLPQRAFEIDHLGRVFHYNEIDLKKDHFYGFGEKTGQIDKKGRRMRQSGKDAIGHDPEFGDPLYKHIPFYLRLNEDTKHALGLFYHNSYESTFDMGQENSGYWSPYSYYTADGGDVDLFFINGPGVQDVVSNYTKLTGKQAMPPKQSLGFTASTMYYAELDQDCDQEIYKVIDSYRNYQMHIDNFWLASGYSSGEEDNLRYVFNWNKKRFPDPKHFFDKMNEKGINVIVNLKPGILANHPMRDVFEENDVFIKTADSSKDYIGRWWGGEGRFVDFTNPLARSTWKQMLQTSILSKGTVTVWNDNCEYDGIEDKDAVCNFDGEAGKIASLKPVQANLMALTAKEAVAELYPDRRPYIINRAGYAGIQRYAQTWAGDNLTDWRTLKFNIATIIGMGLSGVANTGCDIGGFAGGAPEPELLLRWIQNGIFQPRFCINSANNDNTVTQPFMYPENNEYVAEAYKLRYQMIPYLYSMMYEAHCTGAPFMRSLFYEFQDDVKCYNDNHMTFMYGPSLLVANVLEKHAKTRELYLPKGAVWYDISDNMRAYEGGQIISIPVKLSSIPMFLRDTGIFATSDDIVQITRDNVKRLDILFGSSTNMTYAHYEDDGKSKDFEKGMYEITKMAVTGTLRKRITFTNEGSHSSEIEQYNLKVISKERGAYWITVDGRKIKQYLSAENFDTTSDGWYYNLSERTIQIKFPKPDKKEFEVIVSTEQFDLIGME